MRKLNTYVHAVGVGENGENLSQTFGPGDRIPDWARKAITNPKVWVGDEPEESTPDEVKQPPRKGPGSGGPAWVDFASSKGVAEKFDRKEDLIGHLEDRGLIEKE